MANSDEPSGMTAERVRSLESIGFEWTVSEDVILGERVFLASHVGFGLFVA